MMTPAHPLPAWSNFSFTRCEHLCPGKSAMQQSRSFEHDQEKVQHCVCFLKKMLSEAFRIVPRSRRYGLARSMGISSA